MKKLITRREMLKHSFWGAAGLYLAGNATIRALAEPQLPGAGGKAKAMIQIWMDGGPSHIDTFDPKPECGADFCGPLRKAIETNVSGIRIGEMLPLLAKQADKYSIIRSMTHGSDAHETATYMTQTGRTPGGQLVYPCAGAVVSLLKGYAGGYQGQLPPYITLTEPLGRFDEAGFLGTRHRPFATGGDPAQERFIVEGIVAEGLTDEQQRKRRELLHKLDALNGAHPGNPGLEAFARSQDQAYDMIIGDGAKAFDLSGENDALRDRYGRATVVQSSGSAAPASAPRRTTFGQSCLVARRLVERGVPCVIIKYPGWDTHKDHFPEMKRMLPEFDQGVATLLQDLSERGLLESTIVWIGGEFGRTPRVMWEAPWNGGRGHWGRVFSTVIAGGGFKGGQIVGASDAKAEDVKERPVYPCDVIGSVYHQLGIDPAARLPNPQGLDVRAMPTPAEGVPTGGLLKEIM
ncbi:hypothetical protein M2447_000758 [Ereboglobus sp. PH5-10]|uniref:DUF1501 domain-containing protein n=1 Tax=Ereboglobus sp. PH5-10 TaxID=2940629 RepID=UPI002407426A|nr:DUF1501 domain-containing protein [Ereboglobus sp. PH5-10]MDF9826676.1 hypothetical protein [Ereboglobus sp. PH5-10]